MNDSSKLERIKSYLAEMADVSLPDIDKGKSNNNVPRFIALMDGIELERLINAYDHGHHKSLLLIIVHCLWCKIDVPEKYSDAFCKAVIKWNKAEAASLDEAFNVSHPLKWRQYSEAQQGKLMHKVYNEVVKIRSQRKLEKKSKRENKGKLDDVFHIVGKNNGISGGVAKNIFYYAKATYAEKDKAIDDVLKSRVFRLREDQDYKDFVQKISKIHEI